MKREFFGYFTILGLFGAMLLLSARACAQTDVFLPSSQGPYQVIGNNLKWGTAGPGGLTNNFIMVPPSTDSSFCLYAQNTDSGNHTFSFTAYASGNPQVSQFTGNTGVWTPTDSIVTTSVPATSTSMFYLHTRSAARVVLSIVGTGTTTTANFYGVWTQQSACDQPLQTFSNGIPCNSVAVATLTSGLQNTILIAHTSNSLQSIYVCSLYVDIPAGGTSFVDFYPNANTGGSCGSGAPSVDFIQVDLPTTAAQFTYGGAVGNIFPGFRSGLPVQEFCAYEPGSVGVNVQVRILYAQQ